MALTPSVNHATRTEFEHPRSSIRLRAALAVARASSLWKRSPSPMTCFQRANWPSTPALDYSRCALPGHSSFLSDRQDVAVALGGVGVRRGAEYGIGTRWNCHLRVRMALIQGGVDAGSVIAAVAQEDLDGLGDLVEQGLDLGGIIDVTLGQDGGDDPTA